MAQAGFTPILIYASGTATNIPAAGDLTSSASGAELAINYADGKLYYKDGSGNVKLLSIGYGSSSVTPTNGGVQYGTGTALALTAAGSSGQILRSNGAAAPTWADLSTLGVNTISFGTTGLTPNSATAGAVTVAGTLVTANGGTGLGGATPFTANGVLYASSASALTSGSALTYDGTSFATTGQIISGGSYNFNTTAGRDILWGTGSYTYITGNPGTGVMAFGIANTEAMRLTSTGLGIGTSSPSQPLAVQSSANGSTLVNIVNTSTGGYSWNIGTVGAAAGLGPVGSFIVRDSTNGVTRLVLDTSGNLGLGVTPSAWASGWPALQVGSRTVVHSATDGRASFGNNYYVDSTPTARYLANGAATQLMQVSGDFRFFTAPSGTAGNAITFTQAMTLDASGNLIVPYRAVFGQTLSGDSVLQVASAYGGLRIGYNSTNVNYFDGDTQIFRNSAGTTERARITSGGDLLVGGTSNTAQSEKLQVTGNIGMTVSTPQINFYGTGSTIEFVNRDSGGAKTFSWYYAASGGGPPATLSTSGVWTNASDARGKENISEIHYGLDTVMALYPRQYDVKSDGSHAIGFVAQEVLPVVPELVHVTRRTENDEFYGLDYGSMTAVLVKAIQEQQALITSLTARVALLEGN